MKFVIAAAFAALLLTACGQEAEKSTPSAEAEETEPMAETKKTEPLAEVKESKPASEPAAEKPEPLAEVAKSAETSEEETPSPLAEKSADAPEPLAEEAAKRTPSLEGAKVYFILPEAGATVSVPIAVQFGVEGMDIVPAGTDHVHSGHHHLLIDTKLEDYNAPIPSDENHKHFGNAQTEAAIGLAPGKHTLQLLLGDQNHIPHDPPVESEVITITVK